MLKQELIALLLKAGFDSLCSDTFLKEIDENVSILFKLQDDCIMIIDAKGYSCRQKVNYSELFFDPIRGLLMTDIEYDSMVCPLNIK